ncbi:Sigma-70 family [Elusimicrobium minutum Pei191]|uniref:Sigma-70 family n=1 Tax=Elusimicrobium minutum (strain Pei191) TaxID=445932 RepID=B2KBQ8_ELUMP|nr:RNA polymerase sigma factor [Elusimicrobium minutum]ACC97745.1 Sigma-70 family [Elusimicrobium minutum Pei191]
MSETADNELLEQFKKGDTFSLGLLIEKYKTPLYTFIISYVKDASVAEDIFQEVFLKIIKNPYIYKENSNFKAWLFTVSRNKCMDYFRQSGTDLQSLDAVVEEGFSLHETVQSKEKEPLDFLLNLEDAEAVNKALNMLPLEQKEIIIMRQTMSFKEIAQLLSCPIGTVLARASRGYKKMQQQLTINNFESSEAVYAE